MSVYALFCVYIVITCSNNKCKCRLIFDFGSRQSHWISIHLNSQLFHYYLGLSITTCVNTAPDFGSWLPSDAVPSRAMNSCSPVAILILKMKKIKFHERTLWTEFIWFEYSLSADSSNWSNLVFFNSSSINGIGLTRVTSTRPETFVPLSSKPFFLRSAAAFIRSKEPVSFTPSDPALGFLFL